MSSLALSGLWPHWLRPFWLLLLPLLGWLLWQLWHRQQRAGRWQSLLPAAFHQVLLSGASRRNSRLPWLALALAWLLALLALLGPGWERVEQNSLKRADPLVVVLELTPAMLASDVQPNRLAQAKRKLLDLLQSRRDAQTAIVVFAGSAHTLVPLSDDLATSRNLLESLNPSIMPTPGQRADLAVSLAADLLKQGAQGAGKILLIDSGLDPQEQDGIRQALKQQKAQLLILGIGTSEGAPIALEGGGFVKDAQGAILLPRLDSRSLKQLASQLGGRYASASLDDDDLRSLNLLEGAQSLREGSEPTQLTTWADQGHWLLLPLLLLAACAGRRGWLFCLPLLLPVLLAAPQPSYAFEFNDLWLRPDQQGQRLLEAQKPLEAAKRFDNPQWQAQALYQAGDYNGAAERFAQGYSAADHYNRGNALAKAGELEAAIDAYEQALERQADLTQAKQNKALVEQALQQRQQQQQQQQKQDQQQPNKDQQPQDSQSSQQQQQNQAGEQAQKPGEPAPDAKSQQEPGEPKDQSATKPSAEKPANDAADKDQAKQPTEQALAQNPADQQPPAKPGEKADKSQAGTQEKSAKQADSKDPGQPSDDPEGTPAKPLDTEQRQALEQWLRQIPDEPGELLRRKFWYEQQQRQEQSR
ncbi:MAG: VWA domain-containing protein [Pseudomonas sp.]|uniref:VWA domain-containing protein n=1 Tax=Pseudomonas sp. TaxID=306 RepID=UPI00273292FB|nr:VWA domain-containing protein [Pseudomonas sp.]MDP3844828.1 VWA domain-containing protein [Pseudomonas sp.]